MQADINCSMKIYLNIIFVYHNIFKYYKYRFYDRLLKTFLPNYNNRRGLPLGTLKAILVELYDHEIGI